MSKDAIIITGAREHNLKNIHLALPREKLVVITGLSGSGKSSLAFDTIYAEGQRKYVESLSAYARQFLEQLQKPDVDHIEGLSPAIAIEQRTAATNPRSTIATTTEIYEYLRLLFANVGKPHCYHCGRPITTQTSSQIVEQITALGEGAQLMLLAPLVRGRKGEFRDIFARIRSEGFVRARVDGAIVDVSEPVKLDKKRNHDIELVVDRVTVTAKGRARLGDSVETALKWGNGLLLVLHRAAAVPVTAPWAERLFSSLNACPDCGISYGEFTPEAFFLQLALRRVQDLSRSGHETVPRSRPGRARPQEVDCRRRHRGLAARRTAVVDLLQDAVARAGQALQGRPRSAV